MVFLLLAPYHDSIQLGQGFNSFLQKPCIVGAVAIPESSLRTQASRAGGATNVSQTVSYSSRFVEKISDVVRSMNISAASSIKSGTIEISGNSLSVDEGKFSASDMNAVVSVKVVNQTMTAPQQAEFKPLEDVTMDSAEFFETYGDCYVSGFMEGGDLHGIVSVKILDVTKKSEIQNSIKSQMNGGTAGDFTLSEGPSASSLDAALRDTETSVTVTWSGGGLIKPDDQEWTLDSLVRAASGFPSRVAACPQRTWAILTRYTNNRSFVKWAKKNNVTVPNFAPVQDYTSELLDSYMEFKNNLSRLQAAMAHPERYRESTSENPVKLDIRSLVKERELIKAKMRKISGKIDLLNADPSNLPSLEGVSAEEWATRLPIPISEVTTTTVSPTQAANIFSLFPFAQPAQDNTVSNVARAEKEDTPLLDICDPRIAQLLGREEQAFLADSTNKRRFAKYRYDCMRGHEGTGTRFNDGLSLKPEMWPTRLTFHFTASGDPDASGVLVLRSVRTDYDEIPTGLEHGVYEGESRSLVVPLASGERVNALILGWSTPVNMNNSIINKVRCIGYVQVHTTTKKDPYTFGTPPGDAGEQTNFYPYDGCTGLAGFWGAASASCIHRLGPIWGGR